MITVLWIPGWHPTPLNKLLGNYHAAGRLKKYDAEVIGRAKLAHRLGDATDARRLDLHLVVAAGQRRCDKDAYWKSLKDGLVHARLLVDDTPRLCRDGQVTFSKAMDDSPWGTFIILQEV